MTHPLIRMRPAVSEKSAMDFDVRVSIPVLAGTAIFLTLFHSVFAAVEIFLTVSVSPLHFAIFSISLLNRKYWDCFFGAFGGTRDLTARAAACLFIDGCSGAGRLLFMLVMGEEVSSAGRLLVPVDGDVTGENASRGASDMVLDYSVIQF